MNRRSSKSRSSSSSRSYIREFLVAILMLFRPSLPWCFPVLEGRVFVGTAAAAAAVAVVLQ